MSTVDAWLVTLTLAVPLVLAALSGLVKQPLRLLPWAAVPGLLCALWGPTGHSLELPVALLGAALRLDGLGAIFLGLSAFLWTCAGVHAQAYLAGKPNVHSFCTFWHLTLAGSLGVCLAADAITFYLAFATVSLPAYVLVIHDRQASSLRAGRVYIGLAVFGETALLLGLMLGVNAADTVLIEAVREALATAPLREAAVLGLVAGLGLKCGLVPLHGWLPLAHSAAPVPASAVLSGAIVKAGLIGLIRFLPTDALLPGWSEALTWTGLLTAYLAVLLGLPQRLPKAVLAYSTMSQMGLIVAVFGATIGLPRELAQGYPAVTLMAVQHGLAKGALFLAAGLLVSTRGRARLGVLLAAALLGAVIAGLPLSGGALAKLATKEPLAEVPGVAAALAGWSAVGTALLMLRFIHLERPQPASGEAQQGSRRMMAAFLALLIAALLVPWWLGLQLAPALRGDLWLPATLWGAAWPILLALLLAWVALRIRSRAPAVPVGDVAAWAEAAWSGWRDRRASRPSAAPRFDLSLDWPGLRSRVESAAAGLSRWSTAAAALALFVLLFVLTLGR